MTQLDPRLHAFREDLASASLQNRVKAPRYVEGEIRQVAAPAAAIRVAPKFDAPLATEALSGELVTVYDVRDGWAWVQLREDGYVGYTTLDVLSPMVEENVCRVSARLTYLYPAPDIKRPPITRLSFSCTVAPIGKPEGRFVELSRGGFIFADHLVGIRERAKDFVRVAERFVGVPYLWGGKTTLGIDCSGLVQIALQAAGIPCLRDSDMQMAGAGEPLDPSNLDAIQRGDLLFWRGHVAIAQSADWMIHASAHHMEVVVEQIRRAVERTAETHGPLLAILRPALGSGDAKMADAAPRAQKEPAAQPMRPHSAAARSPQKGAAAAPTPAVAPASPETAVRNVEGKAPARAGAANAKEAGEKPGAAGEAAAAPKPALEAKPITEAAAREAANSASPVADMARQAANAPASRKD